MPKRRDKVGRPILAVMIIALFGAAGLFALIYLSGRSLNPPPKAPRPKGESPRPDAIPFRDPGAGALLLETFNGERGGFGAPGGRAVSPAALEYALVLNFEKRDDRYTNVVTKTLDAVLDSETWDDDDGGFWELNEENWNDPHRVKDCEDNAAMLAILCRAHQVTGRREYREAAARCADFALNSLCESGGGFFTQWYPGVRPESRTWPHTVEAGPTAKMASAMFLAGFVLGREDLTRAARKSVEVLLSAFVNADGEVLCREGERLLPGPYLGGAAACLQALTDAWTYSSDSACFRRAPVMSHIILRRFEKGEKWNDLIDSGQRVMICSDAARALLAVARMTGEGATPPSAGADEIAATAGEILADVSEAAREETSLDSLCAYALAADSFSKPAVLVTVAGNRGDAKTAEMIAACLEDFNPRLRVRMFDLADDIEEIRGEALEPKAGEIPPIAFISHAGRRIRLNRTDELLLAIKTLTRPQDALPPG